MKAPVWESRVRSGVKGAHRQVAVLEEPSGFRALGVESDQLLTSVRAHTATSGVHSQIGDGFVTLADARNAAVVWLQRPF